MSITVVRLNLLAFLIVVALGVSGCARHGIILVETSNSIARGVLIGDVTPVREGTLETIRLADVSPGVIDWGLGHGTVEGVGTEMGETLFIAGRPTRRGGVADEGEARFVGPFAVGIAPNQNPAARYRSAPSMRSASAADILSDLAAAYEGPVLVVGNVHFDHLSTGSGLDGQGTDQSLRHVQALWVAVAARNEEILNQASRRVFHIPAGMEGLVDDLMLSSAGVLKDPPRNWRAAGSRLAESMESVVPVDLARSRISGGEIDVYLIGSITQP